MSDSAFLSGAEISRRLGISLAATYSLLRSPDCPFPVLRVEEGKRFRVLRAHFEAYLRGETLHDLMLRQDMRIAAREGLIDVIDAPFLKRELRDRRAS